MVSSALAVVLCLGLVSASPAAFRNKRQAANCNDAFMNIDNPCTSNPDPSKIYFAHPTDNTKFLQCDVFGRMYVIQCPMNEIYDASTTYCTTKTIPTTAAPTMAPTQAPSMGPVVVNPNNGENPCTAVNLAAGNIYFAIAGSNIQFIECDLLGHANVLTCPSGLVWDESRLSCVYEITVVQQPGTGSGTGTDGSALSGLKNPCTAGTISNGNLFFPHPDPHRFLQCDLWGDVFVNTCPTGLVWNDYSKTCASAYINIGGPNQQ